MLQTIAMSAGKPDISIIVPAHNEAENVRPTVEAMGAMLRASGLAGELVFVDDGSTDGTGKIAAELAPQHAFLRVLAHTPRRGLSRALEAGFMAARGDILVFYPADLQFDANDIPLMVAKVREGFDIVTGWKQGHYDKQLISGIYNGLAERLFKTGVHDMNSVKAFRRALLPIFDFRSDFHRYMVVMAVEAGYRAGEVKVKLLPRLAGHSKFGGRWRIMIGVMDMLAVWFQYRFLTRPLLLFGSLGVLALLLGFCVGLAALYWRFVLNTGFRPLLTLTSLLSVVGVLLFAIGLLGESIQVLSRRVEKLERLLERRDQDWR
ncbi:MAG: glycosyltransferase family 2 protein [Lentisphaerae bacterium]|nr:glycosyltransferase family 2 protein [Lentisphaerota bacterium]